MKKTLLSTIVLGLSLGSGFATYAAAPMTYAFANYTGQAVEAQGQTVQDDQTVTLTIPTPADKIGYFNNTTPITTANGLLVANVQSTLKCSVIPHKITGPILTTCQVTQLQAQGVNGYNGHSTFPGGNYVYVNNGN